MPLRAAGGLAFLLLAAGGLYLMLARDPAHPFGVNAPLVGAAYAVDGDTLRLGGTRIRLKGLDAPELDQTCTDGGGAQWDCGTAAHRALTDLVAHVDVTCVPDGHDIYGRVLAHCSAGGADAGAALVTAGLAVASGDYGTEEGIARAAHRGIWQGSFVTPRSWREGASAFDVFGWLRRWF